MIRHLRCSFCRKKDSQVEKLVAGPRVYICDACVAIANEIMNNPPGEDHPPRVQISAWRKLGTFVKRVVRRDDKQRAAHPAIV